MKAYVCVYRHPIPDRKDRHLTEIAATNNPLLRRFLDLYDDQNCFCDWGDDPSFFSASEFLGDVRDAAWGVCRPDVRNALKAGDYVVFFCAKTPSRSVWEYYYIGVGTVSLGLTRQIIWSDDKYTMYRDFFNILARLTGGVLEQHETFHRYHDDWKRRCEAPYWLFDRGQSLFNLVNPLHVATGTTGNVELWHSSQGIRVAQLESILFPQSTSVRRLRSTHPQILHTKINLLKQLGQHTDLKALRSDLMELATG